MTYHDRYNKISKHVFCLALLPQSPYLFKYTCRLLSNGLMRAAQHPVDEHLTAWPWFKAGIAILKQPLFDERTATSPDEFNVSDWAFKEMMGGFNPFVKSLRWYIQKLDSSENRDREDDGRPYIPLEMEYDSAYAILSSIVYQIDGGYLDPSGDHITAHPIENLLFYNNTEIGIREFRPWSLKLLYERCDKKTDLHELPWGTLLNQRATFEQWYSNFLEDPTAGDDAFDAYLTMLEPHLPDISETRWFIGHDKSDASKSMPPPPLPKTKSEKNGMRFEIQENTPAGCTTYKDTILGKEYVISNRTKAKKNIDTLMIADLAQGVKQWHNPWKSIKGAFMRDDAAQFNRDQIIHETKPNILGEKTDQFTGRWRIRTDEEMADFLKK